MYLLGYATFVKQTHQGTQAVPTSKDESTQTEVSFANSKYSTFLKSQDDLDSAFDKLQLQYKLDEVMNGEGNSVLTKRNRLAQTLTTYKFEDMDRLANTGFRDFVTLDKLKADFILVLINYTQ